MDQQTHNRMAELFKKVILLEKKVEEQEETIKSMQEENGYLKVCFEVLRDKSHALAIMVGDLKDRPSGSLRERVSTIEDHLMEMNWRDEILRELPEKETKFSLQHSLEQEIDRLKEMTDGGDNHQEGDENH